MSKKVDKQLILIWICGECGEPVNGPAEAASKHLVEKHSSDGCMWEIFVNSPGFMPELYPTGRELSKSVTAAPPVIHEHEDHRRVLSILGSMYIKREIDAATLTLEDQHV